MNSRIFGMLLAVVLVLAEVSYARTWYVEKDGSGDYTVIQDTVDCRVDLRRLQ